MAPKQLVPLSIMFIYALTMMNNASANHAFINNDATLIDRVCGSTTRPGFCKSDLNSDTRSSSADIKGLAAIVLEHAETKSLQILAQIQGLTKVATAPMVQTGLFCCNQLYGPARDKVSAAILGLDRNATIAASLAAGAAANARTCEDSFRPSPSPLTSENNVFASLTTTAFEIINEMIKK